MRASSGAVAAAGANVDTTLWTTGVAKVAQLTKLLLQNSAVVAARFRVFYGAAGAVKLDVIVPATSELELDENDFGRKILFDSGVAIVYQSDQAGARVTAEVDES